MEKEKIELCIQLIESQFLDAMNRKDKATDQTSKATAAKEAKDCIIALNALKADYYGLKYGELIGIRDGVATFFCYYEENQNDYGPHPLRRVNIYGLFIGYKDLCDRASADGSFETIEADSVQYPQDSPEDTDEKTLQHYIAIREKTDLITFDNFIKGTLRNGLYFVISK